MEQLNLKELDKIPVPDGLEQRLSDSIDRWDKAERRRSSLWRRTTAIAASVVVAAGIGVYFVVGTPADKGTTDTYSDPEQAYVETCKAVDLLAQTLDRGFSTVDKVSDKCKRVQDRLNKQTQSND